MAENKENKRVDPGREFSESVDRMLAGQEPELHPALGDDYRRAVDFARRLREHRLTLRPSFGAQLRERLLSRLSEEEKGKGHRFWKALGSLVPRQPLWQAVVAMLLLSVLAGGVIWGTGVFMPAPPSVPPVIAPTPLPTPAPGPVRPPLEIDASLPQTTYLPGEAVTIEFSFKNVSTKPITMRAFPPEIGVMLPWPYRLVLSFRGPSEELKLKPGEIATYTLVWDQRDASGQQVAPGYYYMEAKDIFIEGTEVGTMRTSSGAIAKVLIQYPQGAMEKSLEVNQSVTASGVTILMERMELSATGAKVYAFTTPPDYTLSPGPVPPLPPPPMMLHADAQYSVDGGPIKEAGPSGSRFLETGIELIWDNLDPIPSDAGVLTFTIVKLGDWSGPWVFEIPLR